MERKKAPGARHLRLDRAGFGIETGTHGVGLSPMKTAGAAKAAKPSLLGAGEPILEIGMPDGLALAFDRGCSRRRVCQPRLAWSAYKVGGDRLLSRFGPFRN